MRFTRFRALLPLIVSFGCSNKNSGDLTWDPYQVEVSGPGVAALGETVTLSVSVDEQPPADTNEDDDDDDNDGESYFLCNGTTSDGPTSRGLPTLTVLSATCSADCTATVTSASDGTITVTADQPGVKNVLIDFITSDTTETQYVTTTIGFREATAIQATREATSLSGSAFGMIVNDSQTWTFTVGDESGDLMVDPCDIQISVDGALAGAQAACGRYTFTATAFGTGHVTASYGAVTRRETITIIDPSTITSADLRRIGAANGAVFDVATDTGAAPPSEDPLDLHYDCETVTPDVFVLHLVTSDGTVAFGSGLLDSSPAGYLGIAVTNQVFATTLVDLHDGAIVSSLASPTPIRVPYTVVTGCDGEGDQ